jgi:hypothetical protein
VSARQAAAFQSRLSDRPRLQHGTPEPEARSHGQFSSLLSMGASTVGPIFFERMLEH